jgi:hypothetical protein
MSSLCNDSEESHQLRDAIVNGIRMETDQYISSIVEELRQHSHALKNGMYINKKATIPLGNFRVEFSFTVEFTEQKARGRPLKSFEE